MSRQLQTDVLIVGAGPSGMTSALCLARAGIQSIIVERAAGLATHPKAHELNARSIEILMGLGVSKEELEAEASPQADASRILFCNTVQEEFGRIDLLADEGVASKYRRHLRLERPYLNLSQTELEKTLLRHVERAEETSLLFGHEWEAFETQQGPAISRVRHLSEDAEIQISSRYVIAADGASSTVRGNLCVDMEGPNRIQDFISAYFEMDLRNHVPTGAKLYWILHPEASGTLIAHHPGRRWVYHVPIFPPHEQPEAYTPEVFQRRLQIALQTDQRIPITSIGFWRMTAQVAERFAVGRVFLVGDAAHRFPPTGGLGMNTGIADAHNLCWKLATVLHGHADEALLDTYEAERRPIAKLNCAESMHNFEKIFEVVEAFGLPREGLTMMAKIKDSIPVSWLPRTWKEVLFRLLGVPVLWALKRFERRPDVRRRVLQSIADQLPHFDRIGLDIGYAYECGALVRDGASRQHPTDPVTEYVPSTRPGARFPHVWLDPPDKTRSTHDVLSNECFTLLHGARGRAWAQAATELSAMLRTTLAVRSIASLTTSSALQEELEALCEVRSGGALLIRPDGHVAWRETMEVPQPKQSLLQALRECHLQ
ncbi:MAG: FAD-dependent monooxygenase [Polyangiales bacterium]